MRIFVRGPGLEHFASKGNHFFFESSLSFKSLQPLGTTAKERKVGSMTNELGDVFAGLLHVEAMSESTRMVRMLGNRVGSPSLQND
jgi:hypothetical protein